MVYDITNPDSFTGAKSWVKELQRRGDPNVVIALAGNKADLEGRRKVEFEEANAYAEENGILHMETSAKNNINSIIIRVNVFIGINAEKLLIQADNREK